MAGTIEHIAVALELIKRWSNSASEIVLEAPEQFLLGNIAPDSIMSRERYERTMKMHTHFRDRIPDHDFVLPENQVLFHRRLHIFSKNLQDPLLSKERDLYLGYITHILTDELFMKSVRPEFMDRIAALGLTDQDAKTFDYFTRDVNQIDFRLVKEYPGMDEAQRHLRTEKDYEIRDMITADELKKSRHWILTFFFEHAGGYETPEFYRYDRGKRFVREAVDFVEQQINQYIGDAYEEQ